MYALQLCYIQQKILDEDVEQPVPNYVEVRIVVVERVDKQFILETNKSIKTFRTWSTFCLETASDKMYHFYFKVAIL